MNQRCKPGASGQDPRGTDEMEILLQGSPVSSLRNPLVTLALGTHLFVHPDSLELFHNLIASVTSSPFLFIPLLSLPLRRVKRQSPIGSTY